jgi:hypothetical protein
VREKHLQANLDEFAFRYNRRKTAGFGRIAVLVNRADRRARATVDASSSTTPSLADGSRQFRP